MLFNNLNPIRAEDCYNGCPRQARCFINAQYRNKNRKPLYGCELSQHNQIVCCTDWVITLLSCTILYYPLIIIKWLIISAIINLITTINYISDHFSEATIDTVVIKTLLPAECTSHTLHISCYINKCRKKNTLYFKQYHDQWQTAECSWMHQLWGMTGIALQHLEYHCNNTHCVYFTTSYMHCHFKSTKYKLYSVQ